MLSKADPVTATGECNCTGVAFNTRVSTCALKQTCSKDATACRCYCQMGNRSSSGWAFTAEKRTPACWAHPPLISSELTSLLTCAHGFSFACEKQSICLTSENCGAHGHFHQGQQGSIGYICTRTCREVENSIRVETCCNSGDMLDALKYADEFSCHRVLGCAAKVARSLAEQGVSNFLQVSTLHTHTPPLGPVAVHGSDLLLGV